MTVQPARPPETALGEQQMRAWLRLSRTENVGPVTFYRLLETYGSAEAALDALPELARRGGRKKPLSAPHPNDIEREMTALAKIGGRMIAAVDPAYPLALSATEDAPPILSVMGNPDLLNRACIGIVGARNASINGRHFAEKLARDLGESGQVVASGLARGIDTAAHTGALTTGTIAVVAGGIDVIYPPENRDLYQQIAERGLIVAESPLRQQPFAQSFPRRNRIVSGLSSGIIVVEATEKSGSLITARMAAEQGRDVYAVPGHPLDPRASGPNRLIRDGAILIRNADDVLDNIRTFGGRSLCEPAQPPFTAPPAHHDTTDIEQAQALILQTLSYTPTDIDMLMRETGLGLPLIQSALLDLELAGGIARLPGNRVIRLVQTS